jgi:hypothetical protein
LKEVEEMRTLLKISIPAEKGNEAIKSGALGQTFQSTMELLNPEASYFFPDEDGNRAALFVFEMEGSWQLPPTVEPLFANLDASVFLTPVMNPEDLERGLKEVGS